jgi:hypothetical protein
MIHTAQMSLCWTVMISVEGTVSRIGGPSTRWMIHQLKCLVGYTKTWSFEFRCLMIRKIWNSFCGPPNVFLELLIKCRNLQMPASLSMKLADQKMGVASRFQEKYNLGHSFFTIPISLRSASTIHIPSAVINYHSLPWQLGKNTTPRIF